MVQGLGLREMWVWWVNFTLRVWGTGESQVMSPEGLTQRFHPPRNTSALKLLLICWHPFYFRNALELFSSIILECELNASHPGWTRGINSPFPQCNIHQFKQKWNHLSSDRSCRCYATDFLLPPVQENIRQETRTWKTGSAAAKQSWFDGWCRMIRALSSEEESDDGSESPSSQHHQLSLSK